MVTDRPLDNLEQPRSALAATCSVISGSRSKEKKEKKGMGMMKDRGGRRRRSASRGCRRRLSRSSGGKSRRSSYRSQGSSSRRRSYITWKRQASNRMISPAALQALEQRRFPAIDWAKAGQLELAVHGVSMLPCGMFMLTQGSSLPDPSGTA